MQLVEKKLSASKAYEGKIVSLRVDTVELENGSRATREIVEHPGGVGVLALDEKGCALMVRQYRTGAGRVMLEIPAGKLEWGEDPARCGMRELEEETGYTAGSFTSLGRLYPTAAYCEEIIHLYLARDLRRGTQHLDEDEFLTVERVPLEELVARCISGEIEDAKTLVAALKYRAME